MPVFPFNPLWLFALLAAPLLIHLINMLRHRKVRWAAMEFLLISQKKNKTRVLLRQILLILTRTLLVGMIVMMLAASHIADQVSEMLGGKKPAHHLVLLDDSYSMCEKSEGVTAFDKGVIFLKRIAGADAENDAEGTRELSTANRKLSVLRFSKATGKKENQGAQFDVKEQTISGEQDSESVKLAGVIDSLRPSHAAANPLAALKVAENLIKDTEGEVDNTIYIVSDFRKLDWEARKEIDQQVQRLVARGAKVQLVSTSFSSDTPRNLSIESLEIVSSLLAADVDVKMEVGVKNNGTSAEKNIDLRLQVDDETPPLFSIANIKPGETVYRRFDLRPELSRDYQVTVSLVGDGLELDNKRYAVLSPRKNVPILILDGSDDFTSSEQFALALRPSDKARTGAMPVVEHPRFLKECNLGSLKQFAGVVLVDVRSMEEGQAELLEKYVRGGGRVAFFLGENVKANSYNTTLYRGGMGLFPLPLDEVRTLPVEFLQELSDVSVPQKHPLFAGTATSESNLLSEILVNKYFGVQKGWKPQPVPPKKDDTTKESAEEKTKGASEQVEEDPSQVPTEVVASLRGGAPLVVERRFGNGKVVVFTIPPLPPRDRWSNWTATPAFVVLSFTLSAWLADQKDQSDGAIVGAPLDLGHYSASRYAPAVQLTPPTDASEPATRDVMIPPNPKTPDSFHVVTKPIDWEGFYSVEIAPAENSDTSFRAMKMVKAVNIATTESELAVVDKATLLRQLGGSENVTWESVNEASLASDTQAALNFNDLLLYLLPIILLLELLLAYYCGYHHSGSKKWKDALPELGETGLPATYRVSPLVAKGGEK